MLYYIRASVVGWLSCNCIVFDQQSYSTSGPVSTWMGDCLCAGKPA